MNNNFSPLNLKPGPVHLTIKLYCLKSRSRIYYVFTPNLLFLLYTMELGAGIINSVQWISETKIALAITFFSEAPHFSCGITSTHAAPKVAKTHTNSPDEMPAQAQGTPCCAH